jgi:hypothetical protein
MFDRELYLALDHSFRRLEEELKAAGLAPVKGEVPAAEPIRVGPLLKRGLLRTVTLLPLLWMFGKKAAR